jgi:hypothetical protein
LLWIFGPGVVLGVLLIALWYAIGLLRRRRAQRKQAALKLAAEKAAAEAAAAEKAAALAKKATLERAAAKKVTRTPGHSPAQSPARSPGHSPARSPARSPGRRRRTPSARGEARVRAALTELGVERAHARLRHARSAGACRGGHTARIDFAGGTLTMSAAERRVLEALQLERELEMTIQLLVSTKVVARPKSAPGCGTVAADQLQLHQASAIKLLEC